LEVQDSDGIADFYAAIAHPWYKIQVHSNFEQEEQSLEILTLTQT